MKDLSKLFPFYLGKLFADIALPKWLISGVLAFLEYVAPQTAPRVLLAACGLVILDTVTGIARARFTGQLVTSAKLGRFVTKCFTYSCALIAIALASDTVPNTQPLHAEIVTGVLTAMSVTEVKSIFENLHAIRPDVWATIADVISKVWPRRGEK